jgi:hypothetical protein
MPIDDPTPELEEILQKFEAGVLPVEAQTWALSALGTTTGINHTIGSMLDAGVNAPTDAQKVALANMFHAALKWLGKKPVPPAAPPPPPAPGTVLGTFKMLDPKTGKLVTKTVFAKGKK